IAWRGHGLGHDVVPALDRVLAEMSPRVTVTDRTRTDRPDWRRLSDAELDELIEQLVRWGDGGGAMQLLMRRRGYSATEAHVSVASSASRPSRRWMRVSANRWPPGKPPTWHPRGWPGCCAGFITGCSPPTRRRPRISGSKRVASVTCPEYRRVSATGRSEPP